MKTCLLFLGLFILVSEEFPKKGYDRVMLYRIEADEQSGLSRLFDAHGNITSKSPGIEVSLKSADQLSQIVNDTSTYGARHSYSHSPTIGLIYYKKTKIIDWLEIALPTNTLSSNTIIRNQWKYYENWSADLDYSLTGLSPSGRERFRKWFRDVGINENANYHSTWDSVAVDYSKIKRKF